MSLNINVLSGYRCVIAVGPSGDRRSGTGVEVTAVILEVEPERVFGWRLGSARSPTGTCALSPSVETLYTLKMTDVALASGLSADLLACPHCDALHRAVEPPAGGRLRCTRCGAVMMTNRPGALDRTLAASVASVILMTGAMLFPFLELSAVGLRRETSVLDAALAFSHGLMAPLAIAVGLLIIVIPIIRALALAYVILPLRLGRPPAFGAEAMLRLAARLKPWAMAEIFIIGVVVALVKVAGMAAITLGPAFWALAFLVVLVVLEGASLCEWTLWQTLERTRRP